MSALRSVDELLFAWPAVCRLAEDEWAKGFAASIAKQSRRKTWKPSPKQHAMMARMVSELYQHRGGDFDLIDCEE